MKMIEGKELDVYWLDGNDGNVIKSLVYLRGTTRLICEIMEMPRYNRASIERTPEQAEARILQSSYVASVEAFCKQQTQKLDKIGIIDNTPTIINSNFKFSNLKRYEAKEDTPAHVFPDHDDDDNTETITVQSNITSWRQQFQS
jgi:hypothetical protein